MMLKLYLQKQTDRSVCGFRRRTDKVACATWMDWHSRKPTRRNKYVMFNCYKWRAVWFEDAVRLDVKTQKGTT